MEDSSVFLQDSWVPDDHGRPSTEDSVFAEDRTLNITTTAQIGGAHNCTAGEQGAAAAPLLAAPLTTVTVTHSPDRLGEDVTPKFNNSIAGLGNSTASSLPPVVVGENNGMTDSAGAAAAAGEVCQDSADPLSAGPPTAHASHGKVGSSVQDVERMSYSGPLREKPLVPENLCRDKKKGTVSPQPLASQSKSQLRVAPTGRSDSDTENDEQDDGGNNGGSEFGSPRHAATATEDDDEDDEEERKFVDEFGFVIDEDAKAKDEKFIRRIDGKQVARREVKWANMAADWDRTNTKMHAKLKERCRKGIPGRLRGVSWQLLIGSRKEMMSSENAGVYVALREKKLRDKEVDEVLGRDLTRTFPNHVLFQDEGGVGQTFLRNVLHAYAGCDPEVGYTQGMAFIVGALSTQMAEEECFWALHSLMYNGRYKMRELFQPGFPLLHQFFYQLKRLLARILPKLSRRLNELQIEPSFYASQWFMTLFVYHFPFRALLRIWDIFFSEGWKIIFRTGIALMKWEEKRLLALDFDELLPALKSLQDGKDAKELVRRAHRIKFKTAELNKYGDEYWANLGTAQDS